MAPVQLDQVYVLGGRVFGHARETTFEQDAYLMSLVWEIKLHETITAGGDVVGAVLRSGQVCRFLAGALVEDGVPWSSVSATQAAEHFAQLRAPDEKATLHAALQGLLLGFFGAGGPSSASSPTASAATDSGEAAARATASPPAGIPSSPASPPASSPATGRRRRPRTPARPASPPSGSASGLTSAPPSPTTTANG